MAELSMVIAVEWCWWGLVKWIMMSRNIATAPVSLLSVLLCVESLLILSVLKLTNKRPQVIILFVSSVEMCRKNEELKIIV
jgi:hypothetical protein